MKDKKLIMDCTKKKVAWKYLFSDLVKYLYFSRIWLWQRPKYIYLDKEAKKAMKEPFMIIMNHQGFADVVLMYYVWFTKRIWFMAHQNCFENKFKAWIFKRLMCIPIDPETGSFAALRQLTEVIKAGNICGVFPEGHINFDSTQTKTFKGGATFLALQTGVDSIQIYRERRKHWWQRNRIIVGKPYNIKQLAGDRPSRNDLDRVNQIVFDNELELKRKYQELIPAKYCQRKNVQVFVSAYPFECDSKICYKQRREEIEACKSQKARDEKFYGFKLLEKVLKENYGEKLSRLHFKKLDSGKWTCDNYKISISHSGELVTIAIADYKVGVDIQAVDQARDINKLSELVYNKEEIPSEVDNYSFSRDWSIKEAQFKLSDDSGFDPKKYSCKDVKNCESIVVSYNNKDYALAVVGEKEDFVSYHFFSPDINIKQK